MNARIKELADQQGLTGPNLLVSSRELEKFAQLIVQECADRIRFCIKNDIDFIAEDIEEHFGVSECLNQ